MTRYLTVAEVVELHDRIMERTGARPEALRDEGLLESAMMRAQTAAYYEEADLVTQAVLMAVGISQNQPFVDGNKRAAFVTLDFSCASTVSNFGAPLELAMQIEQIAEDLTPEQQPRVIGLRDESCRQTRPCRATGRHAASTVILTKDGSLVLEHAQFETTVSRLEWVVHDSSLRLRMTARASGCSVDLPLSQRIQFFVQPDDVDLVVSQWVLI